MIKGICSFCSGSCGIELLVKDNKILEVRGDRDHPITKGYICPKGKALPEIVHSKDRLIKPMKKDKDGNWTEIEYKDAIKIIVKKLKGLKDNFGPESLSIHAGEAGVRRQFPEYAKRFCQSYGTPNYSSAGSHCHLSKKLANKITLGVLPSPDYKNSKCIVLWGYNPSNSNPYQMMDINESIRKGGKLIVVDPQETSLASRADIHLKLRPGTDGALALGLIHVIIKENLYNRNFVEKWTLGFEKLVELVKDYTPEEVGNITEISAETIIEAARILANNNPSNITPGIAIELLSNGFQTGRAISILQAIMGNVDIAGGAMMNSPAFLSSLRLNDVEFNKGSIGSTEFPLFCKTYDVAQANILSDAILEGQPYPIRAMIVIGSNPLLSWPNTNKLRRALETLDFLVVMDNFMTETAMLADLIIPGSFFVERYEIWNKVGPSGEGVIGISPKIIGSNQGVIEWEFIRDIARAMGYEKDFPWNTEEEAIDYRFKKLGKNFEEILNMDYGYKHREFKEKRYEENGFDTPSKKIEIYSQTLKQLGYDPLPVYYEPAESKLSTKELAEEYPLTLSTGARYMEYYHSRYRNIKSLKEYKNNKEPMVRIHPHTAERHGIKNGDMVNIESLRGSINLKAEITEEILPTAVIIQHGWNSANVNELTDNEALDPISGFPPDRSLLVKIGKYKEDK
ncbi:molybdopterin-containing oxidoreductase family protein [Tissierella creatinophila]|uniref:Acetylene hydratase n=1 Tax=Tissierella creatinophila DSM 6911 TaxID=1123403 RepID=A0A1U7M5S9_TISCR|nr:molybdopterin-dependent oxidoreductase [Tissierella creatinophila]OLS02673.1 acetylene hydratase [Tissierella creatinophila DSM 6911]